MNKNSTNAELRQEITELKIKEAKYIRLVDFMGAYIKNNCPKDPALIKEVGRMLNDIL